MQHMNIMAFVDGRKFWDQEFYKKVSKICTKQNEKKKATTTGLFLIRHAPVVFWIWIQYEENC